MEGFCYLYSVGKEKDFDEKKLEELQAEYNSFGFDMFDHLVFIFGDWWDKSKEMKESCTQYFNDKKTHEFFNRKNTLLKANQETIDIVINNFKERDDTIGDVTIECFTKFFEYFDFDTNDLIFSTY